MDIDELQRTFFDSLYTYRIELALSAIIVVAIFAVVAWRRGWLAAARNHRGRTAALGVALLAVGLPIGWYVASPLWIRTELIEPGPVVILDAADSTSTLRPAPSDPSPTAPSSAWPVRPAPPEPTSFAPRRVSAGSFRGTDEFHYGRGMATIVENAPGRFTLRLEDFSVRNGPDLFVYLSPVADDYARGALELGRLKATDGAFGYELPAGVDPADFASTIIWCKQFSHLFSIAPLHAV
jgi:electron transfer DM13